MQKGYCFARRFNLLIVSSSGGDSKGVSVSFLACGWRTILAVGKAVSGELMELAVAVTVFGFI